ncbi:hypothetical protein ACKVMT_07715 [Halobacteriales archaeon Cl-PHB]
MSAHESATTDTGWSPGKLLILAVALLGLGANWALYNFASPGESGSVVGGLVGLLAGGYIAFTAYQYLKGF